MSYTDEFGNIFGEAEDFANNADWENMFVNTPDNPWVAGNVFDYDWSNPTGTGFGMVKNYLGKLFRGEGSTADYGTAIAGLMGLYEQMNKDRSPKMWEGKVTRTPYAAPAVTPQYEAAVQQRPYGERVMGMDPLSYTGPVPTAAPAPTKSIFAPRTAAQGGIMRLARGGEVNLRSGDFVLPADFTALSGGGSSAAGKENLSGAIGAIPIETSKGDGMSDDQEANIDGVQPAAVARDEMIVPRERVAEIGGGDVDSGAKELYKMMDRVRKYATGSKKQIKHIKDIRQFTPGGIAGYAGGGAVAFQTGGTAVNATGGGGSLTGGLSPWVGDYIAGPQGFMSKAWGLGDKAYEAYKGPLTAGLSGLQNQAIADYGNLQVPGAMGAATQTAGDVAGKFGSMSYNPVGSMFNAQQAQAYMNPYLQAALDPQLKELTRQSDIARMGDAARLAGAGAFGGSRQAIMESEGRRNLLDKQAGVLGQGYATAYDKAMQQFNADQGRQIQEAQYGSDFGLKALQGQLGAAQTQSGLAKDEFGTGLQGLAAQMSAGDVQRGVEKENVAAQLAQFQERQKYPYEQLKFMQSMLQGLPVSTSTTTPTTSMFSDLMGGIGELLRFRKEAGG